MGIRSIGIIPDGSRRWAAREGQPLYEAYLQTFRNLRRHVDLLQGRGIRHIHIYAFSRFNLKREPHEVLACLDAENLFLQELVSGGYRIRIRGDLEAISPIHPRIVQTALSIGTVPQEHDQRPLVHFYLGYSLRYYLESIGRTSKDIRDFIESLLSDSIDLIVRTGGAATLSEFLPIEARYAQLFFLPTLFNDFLPEELSDICDRYEAEAASFKYGE
jgi:undecaprenyl pyrophosphate synthase